MEFGWEEEVLPAEEKEETASGANAIGMCGAEDKKRKRTSASAIAFLID